MKWLTGLATILAVCLAVVRPVHADDKDPPKKGQDHKGVEGNWEGPLKVTPQIELRITLEVQKDKDGSLSGKWGSPDESLKDLPLQSIALKGNVLSFTTKHQATYKGTLNEKGTEVKGDWAHRGKSFPLKFKRFDPAKVAVKAIPHELEGIWEGKLKVNGGIELRLALKVEKGKDGALKAALASPDQGANNIPISSISLKEDTLTFESKIIGAKFSGKKDKEGTFFEGEFNQMGAKLPLKLKKTDKISEALRPQTPKPPFPYRSEEVSYENKAGNVKLAGTLTIPQGDGPFSAVVMITGSGAQDRDESILGHKPFLVIADYLTRRGVAVLRLDDRGVGGSTGRISTSTSDDFAGDALAGVAFLKGRKEINPAKIGMIGHSEGGIIAPIAATRSTDVAFIVLMAGTGLPGDKILEAQGQLILKASGASDAHLKFQRDAQQRLIAIIADEKDEKAAEAKLSAELKRIFDALPESEKKAAGEGAAALSEAAVGGFNNAWFRSFLRFDPRTTLRNVHCPVLALNGEKDLQVPAKENLAEIEKAVRAGGNCNVKTIEFKGLNHLFQPCKTGAPSEYAAIETTIAPEALQAMGDWIAEQTRGK
jgi:pimeloyl-ACP methyl ester carboxylesterase